MVSGLVTSPCDQLRIFSGDARLMRMASKSAIGFTRSKGLERYKVFLQFLRHYAAARGSQNDWPGFSGQQFARPSHSGAGNGSRSFQSLKAVLADSGRSTGTDHYPLTPSLLPP